MAQATDGSAPHRRRWHLAAAGYLACWSVATAYLAVKGADWSFPIVSLGIFGVGLSAIAWMLTRRSDAPPVPVARPRVEAGAVVAYLLVYAFLFLGWGISAVRGAVAAGQARETAVLLLKLLVHVAVPLAILRAIRAPIREMFDSGVTRRGFWPALIVLGAILVGLLAVVSPGLKQIAALHASLPTIVAGLLGAYLWLAVAAGLCEEFLFRAVVQSRLTALLQSPAWGVVLSSLLFALAHVPGLYLRGSPQTDGWSPDPVQVVAYTIAALSPLSIFFGVVWARTRSLLLIVALHAAVDVLPFTADFIRTWLE